MATKKTETTETKEVLTMKDLKDMPQAVSLVVEGQTIVATLRTFASGSIGYYANGKIVVGGKKIQVGANLIIVGTKPE